LGTPLLNRRSGNFISSAPRLSGEDTGAGLHLPLFLPLSDWNFFKRFTISQLTS
jgi:hypothetical protein